MPSVAVVVAGSYALADRPGGDFYVYALISQGVIFYVGKGRNDRWREHGRPSNDGTAGRAIKALEAEGLGWQAIKLAEGLDEQEAFTRERAFLQLVDPRPLANKVLNPWLAYLREHKVIRCIGCDEMFQRSRKDQRTCSDRCRKRLERRRKQAA